jgi:hypothetical protein
VLVDVDDSQDLWGLSRAEHAAVAAKSMSNRLSFALFLKYFGIYGRFPRSPGDLDRGVIASLAKQIGSTVTIRNDPFELDRTVKRYRAEIRAFFGFRGATVRDARELTDLSAGDECLSRQRPTASIASYELPYMPTKNASIRRNRLSPDSPPEATRRVRQSLLSQGLGHPLDAG